LKGETEGAGGCSTVKGNRRAVLGTPDDLVRELEIQNFLHHQIKKIFRGSDLPVLLVSLFNSHDFVNPYSIGIDVIKQGIFHRYVHTPTGFACREFPDIPHCIRMIRQPLDMFTNNPAIFPGELPDELFYTVFDFDFHIPVLPSSILSLSSAVINGTAIPAEKF